MPARDQQIRFTLLVVALLGPIFHLAGIMARGLALLDADYSRLGLTYLALAVSAACAAYLVFRSGSVVVRIAAGIALLANLGSIAYIGGSWSRHMQQTFTETELVPFDPAEVGILVSPQDDSATAANEARAIEKRIRSAIRRSRLEDYIDVRYVYPISSDDQARRLAERMRANIVVWKHSGVGASGTPEFRVAVYGANESQVNLDPLTLMLLMATEETFAVQDTIVPNDDGISPYAEAIAAPLAAGFGFLSVGRPLEGAAQFTNVLEYSNLPESLRPTVRNQYATALLLHDRDDLALEEYRAVIAELPNACSWVGVGNVAIARREWDVAADAYTRAIAMDPYDAVPYCGLGITYTKQRNPSMAVSSYNQAIALQTKQSVPYVLLGQAYELTGQIDDARSSYGVAAQLAGPNAGLQLAAAQRSEDILRHPPTAVPTATPRPQPTATPIPTSAMYSVQKGDTLSSIAAEHDITIDELMELNEIDNPSMLSIGQTLIIPEKP